MRGLIALSIVGCIGLSGCEKPNKSEAYTLYRGSLTSIPRIHVATFDVDAGEEYNRENCQIAAALFAEQLGVTVPYWCEKGTFVP